MMQSTFNGATGDDDKTCVIVCDDKKKPQIKTWFFPQTDEQMIILA
jgi:hypothetical protein